jgi:beta-lactamase superfamily II metal-dependent hydrolase
MRIHAIDAAEGDCLLLEDGGQFALVDGGVTATFARRLMPHLGAVLGAAGRLEAVIVSHVDSDHISGVLELFAEIERARADEETDPVVIADLWHNGFGATLDTADGALVSNLQAMMGLAGRARLAADNGSIALLGIAQGARLQRLAAKLGIPRNTLSDGVPIVTDDAEGPEWSLGAARFSVVGPTRANLDALRDEWIAWIDRHMDAFAMGDSVAMANADKSIPNLSSIVILGETLDGEVLLTGDARGDHILQGLEATGHLQPGGTRPLRLLKVQHHGSDRNVTADFFSRLPAETYLISANGRHGNPDQETLAMIVDTAAAEGRHPRIVVTNECPSLAWLRSNRPLASHGYELVVRDPARHAVVVDLGAGSVV